MLDPKYFWSSYKFSLSLTHYVTVNSFLAFTFKPEQMMWQDMKIDDAFPQFWLIVEHPIWKITSKTQSVLNNKSRF